MEKTTQAAEDWQSLFASPWFWLVIALLLARMVLRVYGVPRRLLVEAQTEAGAARFARDIIRFTLRHGLTTRLGSLSLPICGTAAAILVVSAVSGSVLSAAALTMLGPVVAVSLIFEPEVREAANKATEPQAQQALVDRVEQIWRLRLATSLLGLGLGMVLAQLWPH
ncbi:MAG: hypothetical protein AAFV62_09550 [Pseudomonadota bacterium]